MALTLLPNEILRKVTAHAGLMDACVMAQVCTTTRNLFDTRLLISSRVDFLRGCYPRCMRALATYVNRGEIMLRVVQGHFGSITKLKTAQLIASCRLEIKMMYNDMRILNPLDFSSTGPRTFQHTVYWLCNGIFSLLIEMVRCLQQTQNLRRWARWNKTWRITRNTEEDELEFYRHFENKVLESIQLGRTLQVTCLPMMVPEMPDHAFL